jgi:hypothetical protein
LGGIQDSAQSLRKRALINFLRALRATAIFYLIGIAIWFATSPALWLLMQTTAFKRTWWLLILDTAPLILRGGGGLLVLAAVIASALLVWRLLRIQFGGRRS